MNKYQKIKTTTHNINNLATVFRLIENIKTSKLRFLNYVLPKIENENVKYKITHKIYIGNPHELKITLWKVKN